MSTYILHFRHSLLTSSGNSVKNLSVSLERPPPAPIPSRPLATDRRQGILAGSLSRAGRRRFDHSSFMLRICLGFRISIFEYPKSGLPALSLLPPTSLVILDEAATKRLAAPIYRTSLARARGVVPVRMPDETRLEMAQIA